MARPKSNLPAWCASRRKSPISAIPTRFPPPPPRMDCRCAACCSFPTLPAMGLGFPLPPGEADLFLGAVRGAPSQSGHLLHTPFPGTLQLDMGTVDTVRAIRQPGEEQPLPEGARQADYSITLINNLASPVHIQVVEKPATPMQWNLVRSSSPCSRNHPRPALRLDASPAIHQDHHLSPAPRGAGPTLNPTEHPHGPRRSTPRIRTSAPASTIRRSPSTPSAATASATSSRTQTRVRHQVEIAPGAPRRRRDLLRKGRPAPEALLRSAQDPRGHRHLRRALPRPQQRHPLRVPGTPLQLWRPRSPRHPPRLPGPDRQGPAARSS